MSRRRSGSQSLSSGDGNGKVPVGGRTKKAASAEPFASNESQSGSSECGGNKKKKTSFWSNLFKSKISEEGLGPSSSFESVNSVATTNSFSFVSPKKYKGKGKGKRIPVDQQTLPTSTRDRGRDSLPRTRNGKTGTLSRFGIKIGLKKKYNLQSCESLQNILTIAPVQRPPPVAVPAPQESAPRLEVAIPPNTETMEASPQMSSGYDSSTWGTNTRRKGRAPPPPAAKSSDTSTGVNVWSSNEVVEGPRERNSEENVKLKSVTGISESQVEKRASFPYGALRRNNKSGDNGPSSIFASHSRYQHRRCGSDDSSACNSNTKTRTHVRGKKKAPPPPNPFGDPDEPELTNSNTIPAEPQLPQENIPNNQNKSPLQGSENHGVEFQASGSNGGPGTSLATETSKAQLSKNQQKIENKRQTLEVEAGISSGNPFVSPCSPELERTTSGISGVSAGRSKINPEITILPNKLTSNTNLPANEPNPPKNSLILKNASVSTSNSSNPNPLPLATTNHEASQVESTPTITQPVTSVSTVSNISNSIEIPPLQAQLEDEVTQNMLNDRQEKAQECVTTSNPPVVTTVSEIATASTNSTTTTPSTSTSKGSSKGTKSRFFNFSKSRPSSSSQVQAEDRVIKDTDIEEAHNELDILLKTVDSNGTLRLEAKKVDEEVKAQLVELKKESDKSPMLFFASKSKKHSKPTATTSSSSFPVPPNQISHNGSSSPSSPEPPPGSPSPYADLNPIKVTPRPWYKRSISSSKGSGNKPKILPKPTSSITMLTKFSDLDREAQKIVEENRRKSAEIEFNQNARELINMFNSTFTPTAEEHSNNDSNENSTNMRNEELALIPTSVSTIATSTSTSTANIAQGSTVASTASSLSTSTAIVTNGDVKIPGLQKSSAVQPYTPKSGVLSSFITTSSSSSISSTTPTSMTQTQSKVSTSVAPTISKNTSISSTSSASVPTSSQPSLSYRSGVPKYTSSVSNGVKVSTTPSTPSVSLPVATPSVLTPTTVSSSIVPETSTVPTSTSSESSNGTAQNPKSSEPEWTCPKCTLKNSHWRAMCEACYHRKDSPALNPISSIFNRVNGSNKTSSADHNLTPQGLPSRPSHTASIAKPNPPSNSTPSCENFLSQLPSKNGSSGKEKLEGMKLNATIVGDPEVEELDIEKLRQARLAFFAKDQQIQSEGECSQKIRQDDSSFLKQTQRKVLSDSLPNNLAVTSSSADRKIHQNESKELNTTNVFSDGEDDYIDSLLQLQPTPSEPETRRNRTALNHVNELNSEQQRPAKPQRQPQPQLQAQPQRQAQPQPPPTYRFYPQLESITETDSNYYSTLEFHRIYENWHRSQECNQNVNKIKNKKERRNIGSGQLFKNPTGPMVLNPFPLPIHPNMFMRNKNFNQFPVPEYPDSAYPNVEYDGSCTPYLTEAEERGFIRGSPDSNHQSLSNFRSFNNPDVYSAEGGGRSPVSESDPNYSFHLNNNSASSSDTEGSPMDRKSHSGRRNGSGSGSGYRNGSFGGERRLTYDDYRKLGAVPKGYHCSSDQDERRFSDSDGEPGRRRSTGHGGSDRRNYDYDQQFNQFRNDTRSPLLFSQESKAGVDKLLRKLEWAISHGEHRLAAKLAHDLAIRKVNYGSPTPEQGPITLRVYVEDRFMQQGPFLVQMMPSMSLNDLKSKIEGDWGIPSGFQKWILGKRMVEDDSVSLASYEVSNDTMAFLYLVTPQIEQLQSTEQLSRTKDLIPPPIPDKPANNYVSPPTPINISNGNHVQSSKNTFPVVETRDNRRPNSNDFSKPCSSEPTDKKNAKMPLVPPINPQMEQDPPELPVKFYRKPSPPKGSVKSLRKSQSPTNNSSSDLTLQLNSSIPKDKDTSDRIVPTSINSKEKPPSQNHDSKVNQNSERVAVTPTRTSISKNSEKQTSPSRGNKSNAENITITTKPEMQQLKPKRSPPPPVSNVKDGPNTSVSSDKQNRTQNLNLPISLQQKLANLREAAEQAFGKSFGQSVQNSEKSSSTKGSLTTDLEIKKSNGSLKKEDNISQKLSPSIQNQVSIPEVISPPKESNNHFASATSNMIIPNSGSKPKDKPVKNEVQKNVVVEKLVYENPVDEILPINNSGSKVNSNKPILSSNTQPKTLIKADPSSKIEIANVSISETSASLKPSSYDSTKTRITATGSELSTNLKELKSSKTADFYHQNSQPEVVVEQKSIPEKQEESFKNVTDLVVQIEEPKPVPRLRKQDNSTEVSTDRKTSPTNSTQQAHCKTEVSVSSTEASKLMSNGFPQNKLVTKSKVIEPTSVSANLTSSNLLTKVELVASSVTSQQPAFPPPRPPSKLIQAFENVDLTSTPTSTSATPSENKSPFASGVTRPNKSPSPTVKGTATLNEASPVESKIQTRLTSPLPQLPVSIDATSSTQGSSANGNGNSSIRVQPLPMPQKFLKPSVPVSQIKGFRAVEPLKWNQIARPLKETTYRPSFSGPFVPTPKDNGDGRLGLQRKNSDSSIVNMDILPPDVTEIVGGGSKELLEGATALPDDKKEDNVETYLKMLQLMEKQDLILTTEKTDCPVCFLSVSPGEGVTLRDCLHNFCKECLVGAVEYAEEIEVKCPFRDNSYSCNSTLQEREIKALVPANVFEKYLARSVKLAERKMMNTFHCKTNDCTGWCIFEDDVNIFKCPVCNQKNCITCAAIHDGVNCQQYQRELAIASETDENAKSSRLMLEKMIQRGEALDCPACHVVLLKKWGCDWVRCSYCKTEICWVTKGFRWGKGGKGDMSGGCKCGVNGVRCHPKCTYCH